MVQAVASSTNNIHYQVPNLRTVDEIFEAFRALLASVNNRYKQAKIHDYEPPPDVLYDLQNIFLVKGKLDELFGDFLYLSRDQLAMSLHACRAWIEDLTNHVGLDVIGATGELFLIFDWQANGIDK